MICSVKSYHLESALEPLHPCIGKNTVILPLLNGVDARERIQKLYPETEIWEGTVYIMARLSEPGVITELGNIHQYHFGSNDGSEEKLKAFENLLLGAGIEAYLSKNIEQTIWDKYLLISSAASLTSYLDLSIGEIFADPVHREKLLGLMKELKTIGEAKGIIFSEGVRKDRFHS